MLIKRDFKNLIHKIAICCELVQRLFKKLKLKIEIHPFWSVKADQASVDRDIRVLSFGART